VSRLHTIRRDFAIATDSTIRGLTRRWRERAAAPGEGSSLVQRVFARRGLGDAASAARFLEPSLRDLHDPSTMPGLDRAAERLLQAASAREPIVIYADYDVDGATAAGILYHTLALIAPETPVRTYVPHRLDEGYGLHREAIAQLAAEGARLIVSVDCGITASGPAEEARARGVDLIITDHHTPPARVEDLPRAYALVHPRLPGSAYAFGELSGAGVAYKLAWRLATLHSGGERVTPALRELLVELLALAALGAVADVVPLVGENRVLARFGLARIKHSRFAGLQALVEASGLAGDNVQAEDVGFKLAPRLNACGRMGHARDTVELLTTATGERARELARQLSRQNEARRRTERAILEQALLMAEQGGMTGPDRRAIVLSHPDWHAGVVGIVCSRLVDRFARPVVLLSETEGSCHGSGRSIEGFSLHGVLETCADLFDSWGGHDMAAGVRLPADRFEQFRERFLEVVHARLAPEDLVRTVEYDASASAEELTARAVGELAVLAPFGAGNPRVRLRLTDLRLTQDPKTFGTSGDHASLMVRAGRSTLRLVGWNWAEPAASLRAGMSLEAVVEPAISTWGGTSRVEPELVDLRVVDGTA
jgi:single-stranded-DNA-specific exonuclease